MFFTHLAFVGSAAGVDSVLVDSVLVVIIVDAAVIELGIVVTVDVVILVGKVFEWLL